MKIGLMIKEMGHYQDLAQGLTQHGHDVITFLHADPLGTRDYFDMASFMQQAQGYDLIHNIIGPPPLLFSRFLETPLLTTI
ncbi:MAG: hypothetical protein LLG43_08200, partial [Deltaproteobacteria bacterium]|nr:hypothetical protein [Deltaproteobacteria bacterium]